jgi:hypothetical protein
MITPYDLSWPLQSGIAAPFSIAMHLMMIHLYTHLPERLRNWRVEPGAYRVVTVYLTTSSRTFHGEQRFSWLTFLIPALSYTIFQNSGDNKTVWFQSRSLARIIAQSAYLALSARFLSGSFWDVSIHLSPAITFFRRMVSRHGLIVLPRTNKKTSDQPEQVSQDNHWRCSTFDLHQETNVPMIEAFGEKIYEKCMQRCRFPLILIHDFESAFSGACAIWNFVNLLIAIWL